MEWDKYTAFASRRGRSVVPGRDAPWDLLLVYDYMLWRGETCKPSTLARIFSILTHFGTANGFLLSNSRHDNDSLTYRRLKNMKKQLVIDFSNRFGADALVPNRCTPLGKWTVALLLSAFGATDKAKFAALSRLNRHHLACNVMQHSEGMRFGHFLYRQYTIDDFIVDGRDGTLRLTTDWHRYAGTSLYCLSFRSFPACNARWYSIRSSDGDVVDRVSAATVLNWHFDILRRQRESAVFAPVVGVPNSRADRAAWLKSALLRAIPASEVAARQQVEEVTPHSFRPGLAGDLLRVGKRIDDIAAECRWHGVANARMYSERPPLRSFMCSAAFNTISRVSGASC